jgi:hypothetical protein
MQAGRLPASFGRIAESASDAKSKRPSGAYFVSKTILPNAKAARLSNFVKIRLSQGDSLVFWVLPAMRVGMKSQGLKKCFLNANMQGVA